MIRRGWKGRRRGGMLVVSGLLAVSMAAHAAAEPTPDSEPKLDAGVPFEVVVVDLKADPSGIVSATLVNRLTHSVQNVRLLIRHEWLWDNEMSPGPDWLNPGRAVYYTVEGVIPAQGRKEFVYRPDPPLRGGASGHFRTHAEVVGFGEVGD